MPRLLLCEVTDTRVEELKRRLTRSRLANLCETLFLFVVDHRDFQYVTAHGRYEPFQYGRQRLCEVLHQLRGVIAVVVVHVPAVVLDKHLQAELRLVHAEPFPRDFMPPCLVHANHANLIDKGCLWVEAVVGGNLGKRIVFVAHGRIEHVVYLPEVVFHRSLSIEGNIQRQCVDKHACGI